MTDLSLTIAAKSDQMNADDLISGPRSIKITDVTGSESREQPVSVHFEGDAGKPFKPCLSMRRVLVQVWGSDGKTYSGRSMTLYVDPEVKFGGIKVGGIRISHMSHIDKPIGMMLTATRARRREYIVKPMATNADEDALFRAKEAAAQGVEVFTEFWNSDFGKSVRDALRSDLSALKKQAYDADAAPRGWGQKAQDSRDKVSSGKNGNGPAHWTTDVTWDEAFPGSDEFTEGSEARKSNTPVTDCPYEDHMEKAVDWIGGWYGTDKEGEA
jgi:hypothetical protein